MHWNTVTPLLRHVLELTMTEPIFDSFRLVGGTSLSLQIGHRTSVDIDLFTDADYGTIDFSAIDKFFRDRYHYVDTNQGPEIGMGTSYYIGESEEDSVKIDIYYTDPFIRQAKKENNIRLASIEDIIAMKLDIIGRGGRKKDFWDLHELNTEYDILTMIDLYKERYPYGHSEEDIRAGLVNFLTAEDDFDPICLRGKHWELIKLDFVQWLAIA
jgi:predicted nucleotidyltransferase component of viral defense system